jgi:hypothetical protein
MFLQFPGEIALLQPAFFPAAGDKSQVNSGKYAEYTCLIFLHDPLLFSIYFFQYLQRKCKSFSILLLN